MEYHAGLSFESYDRLFPNQDILPLGGFGNLIALPLQHSSRQQGNSVFIDKDFQPYTDQWAYLVSIKKVTGQQLEMIVHHTPDIKQDSNREPWLPVFVKLVVAITMLCTLNFDDFSLRVQVHFLR